MVRNPDKEGSSSLLQDYPDKTLGSDAGEQWTLDDGDQDWEQGRASRSRSRSFYTVEPPLPSESEGPRTRARSRSFQKSRVSPAEYQPEQDSNRTLKDREKQALEEGLADAAKEAELRAQGTFGRMKHADSDSDYETTGEAQKQPNTEKFRKIKILMLGDVGVGKTSLMTRWTENQFHSALISTAGVDFTTKELTVGKSRVVVQIWDTAGQERFHVITHSYYRGCNGIALVLDATTTETQRQRLEYWLGSIKAHSSKDVQVAVLCNKSDLMAPEDRLKSEAVKAGEAMAKAQGYPFFFTSAKTAEGVHSAFALLVQRVLDDQSGKGQSKSTMHGENGPRPRGCAPFCTIS